MHGSVVRRSYNKRINRVYHLTDFLYEGESYLKKEPYEKNSNSLLAKAW